MRPLYILGAGGFAREVAWIVTRINDQSPEWNLKGFISNDQIGKSIYNCYKVLGNDNYLLNLNNEIWVVCAIGSSVTRNNIISCYKKSNIHFATLIDPSAKISKECTIGEGSIICAGNIITVNVSIGQHVIINLNSTIGHDAVLNNFVTVCPGVNISGNVNIGERTEIGTGSKIIQGKNIAQDVIIGAGGVVVKDITEKGTYVGVPVKRIK